MSVGFESPYTTESLIFQAQSVNLTYSMDALSRGGAAGITTDAPAFQQGAEGPRFILWRCTAQTEGAAQNVDPTRLSKGRSGGV